MRPARLVEGLLGSILVGMPRMVSPALALREFRLVTLLPALRALPAWKAMTLTISLVTWLWRVPA